MAKQLQSLQPQIFNQHLLNGSLLSPAGRIYGLLPDSGFTRMLQSCQGVRGLIQTLAPPCDPLQPKR